MISRGDGFHILHSAVCSEQPRCRACLPAAAKSTMNCEPSCIGILRVVHIQADTTCNTSSTTHSRTEPALVARRARSTTVAETGVTHRRRSDINTCLCVKHVIMCLHEPQQRKQGAIFQFRGSAKIVPFAHEVNSSRQTLPRRGSAGNVSGRKMKTPTRFLQCLTTTERERERERESRRKKNR